MNVGGRSIRGHCCAFTKEILMISSEFHVQLYCVDGSYHPIGTSIDYNGLPLQRSNPPAQLSFFNRSFEQVLERLLQLPGVYAEWDGSWSWTASEKNERGLPAWRIEGMIYDRDAKVFYVDMQGRCTSQAWDTIISALEIPEERSLAICLATLGAWVDRESFEIWIKSTSAANAS